ncbi:hypothetical protein STEG23_000510 [Scotinomys teguina]
MGWRRMEDLRTGPADGKKSEGRDTFSSSERESKTDEELPMLSQTCDSTAWPPRGSPHLCDFQVVICDLAVCSKSTEISVPTSLNFQREDQPASQLNSYLKG